MAIGKGDALSAEGLDEVTQHRAILQVLVATQICEEVYEEV